MIADTTAAALVKMLKIQSNAAFSGRCHMPIIASKSKTLNAMLSQTTKRRIFAFRRCFESMASALWANVSKKSPCGFEVAIERGFSIAV